MQKKKKKRKKKRKWKKPDRKTGNGSELEYQKRGSVQRDHGEK